MDKKKILQMMNSFQKESLMTTLGIRYVDCGENFLIAQMEITPKIYQHGGILHGGASAGLAESVGSAASFLYVDAKNFIVNGLEMSVNHLKRAKEGTLIAKATNLHKGRTTHLWEVKITNGEHLVCFAKITNIILPKN